MWNSADIQNATQGRLQGPAFEANSVVIDSRKIAPGCLFVAIKGERVDGHDYVAEAFAKGASAAIADHIPKGVSDGASLVIVKDTLQALTGLAKAARKRSKARIIAVTGSVGKTGTKDAIRLALGNAYATEGNLNNHIGLPLSLANLPLSASYGVFELGMNHAGELAALTNILHPDISVITNVEAVHLEFFANVEAIADAKAEIMQGMQSGATIVLNKDNAHFERLAKQAQKRHLRIVTFGANEGSDYRLLNYKPSVTGSEIEANILGTPMLYRLATLGRHYAYTSLAALAASVAAGADLADAAATLAHFQEPMGRGRVQRVNQITLIDDCYNASPTSMRAGIAKLAELHHTQPKGRSIAILGDMLELGASAADLHKALLPALEEYHISTVFAAGPLMKSLYDLLPTRMQGAYATSAEKLAPLAVSKLHAGDTILIKGSRGSRMDIMRDAIIASQLVPSKESANAL